MKLDTGMHRVGADPEDARALVEEIVKAKELSYGGLWTHLAVADEPDDPFTDEQLSRFEAVRKSLQAAGLPPPARLHAANSAGTIAHPRSRYDMVRCGMSLYGYLPSPAVAPELVESAGAGPLRPALAWKTQVSHVRELAAGERTSYGLAYKLSERADIATVPVGYADGVPARPFRRRRRVLDRGSPAPRGRCRDDGPAARRLRAGLGGETRGRRRADRFPGSETVTAQEWAERLGTVVYEVLCRIGPRLPRRHVRGHVGQP